jgi:hypothetical protein
MRDKEYLLRDALNDLAAHLGDSPENPLSLHLLFLNLELPWDLIGKLVVAFNQLLVTHGYDLEMLSLDDFKMALVNLHPGASAFADEVVIGIIKGLSRDALPELYPFSKTL